MGDAFEGKQPVLDSPAFNAETVAPDNDNDMPNTSRAIYVGGTGDLEVVMADGGAAVTFRNVVSGSLLPIRAARVRVENTTATHIVCLY